MSKEHTRVHYRTPGWFVLTYQGAKQDEGENLAALCIHARELGRGALVEEVPHPVHGHPPFGFSYGP